MNSIMTKRHTPREAYLTALEKIEAEQDGALWLSNAMSMAQLQLLLNSRFATDKELVQDAITYKQAKRNLPTR